LVFSLLKNGKCRLGVVAQVPLSGRQVKRTAVQGQPGQKQETFSQKQAGYSDICLQSKLLRRKK
jgi:hypothetical protein